MVVRKFAEEVVGPKVEAMDEAEKMDPSVIKALFEQGVSYTRHSRISHPATWIGLVH